ncbi:hypothetical protein RUM44_004424 [Polyplax serrata]|uniref:Proactivator polypeptide n=1 Tax=Polyplax serrata TaxID=468196 RepID=A0ABR1B2U1_POLSC
MKNRVSAHSLADPACGPESCNDLKTVKACQNVQYCISSVWSKKHYSGPSDNVCQICLEMVKEARDVLQSNETMSELKQVLEGTCEFLRIKPAVEECDKLADEFAVELVQILASQMEPRAVCSIAKLCNNAKLREEQINSDECTTCQAFVTSAADAVQKAPDSDLLHEYNKICRALGTYSDGCTSYLYRNSETILKQTREALANQPCEASLMCPRRSTVSMSERLSHISNQTWQKSKENMCTLCPRFMKQFHFLLKGQKNDVKLMSWARDLCTSLSLPDDTCFGSVKLLLTLLNSNTDYQYICKEGLGICQDDFQPVTPQSPKKVNKLSRVVISGDTLNIRPINNNKRVELSFGDPLPGPFKALPLHRLMSPDIGECQACTNMFNAVSQYIGSHQEYVDSILRITCNETNQYEKCLDFTKDYGFLFKDSSHIEPEKVCPAMVPFCDGKPSRLPFAQATPEKNCNFCVDVLDSLNFSTRTKAAEEQIKLALKDTCKKTPTSKREICNQIAENFIKNIMASVTGDLSSFDTCGYLNLCGTDTNVPKVQKPTDEPMCKACLLVAQYMYDELKDKSNIEVLEEMLRDVCKKLPDNVSGTCQMVVDLYMGDLIQMLTNMITPSELCHQIHFCPNKLPTRDVPKKDVVVKAESEKKVPCSFCLTAVNMVINQLKDNKTEDEIRNALDHLCTYMPEEVRDTCKTLINQYTDEIVDMIIADFNATEICIYLKLCGPKSEALWKKPNQDFGFSIATNEIWRKYNPKGACYFCRLMEKSIAVNKEQGANGMYGLLTDVCLMDGGKMYAECAKRFAEEIVPVGRKALLKMSNICSEMNVCRKEEEHNFTPEEKVFQQVQKAVQECAMCESITGIVVRHLKLNASKYDFAGNASTLCSSVPDDKKEMCESMLTSYAPSIVNLLTIKKVEPNNVCFEVALCDKSAQTKINLPVSSLDQSGLKNVDNTTDCLKGPSYWCANLANAKKCGTVLHCRETVWKYQKL